MQWVLDTTVLIDLLRGKAAVERVRGLLESGDTVATTSINVEEIVRGSRPSEEEVARALVDGLDVLAVTERDAWLAGTWRREHAARGTTLAQADCQIAAVARNTGSRLASANP